ncbi:MAG: Z1 domain-containing protein [Verrucomicrobiota bacterium]
MPAISAPPLNLLGYFYPAYKAANPTFDANTFSCAEKAVAKILKTATTSEHPGMLLGKVQSGKTRTFISILALAFDNGFDIAIVLSKNSRPLIQQTYKRLGAEFINFVQDGEMHVYDIMECPDSFSPFELEAKMIFVAKKQKDNLARLKNLFTQKCPAMAGKRVLIIDDEADSASIGYTKRRDLIEANIIAVQISDYRSHLQKSSFLQVTATPYSLYLQPNEVVVANVVSFKPTRPAFTELVLVPPDYVGGDTYFGEASRSEEDTLQSLIHHTVEFAEFNRLKKQDGRSYKPAELLTTDLFKGFRHAMVTFLVGGCIQRINGIASGKNPRRLCYSFLIHSEAAKGSHVWQEELTGVLIDKLRKAADENESVFHDLVSTSHADLARSLTLDGLTVPPVDTVIATLKEALHKDITISKVNSDDDVSALLDDSGQLKLRSPLCIFIGGQVLDRGVTLANLIGFYYGRRPKKYQQDTVLQHSRMYGYRRPDLAVTRFYTSAGIRHAMGQMEEFDASLRSAIEAGGDRAVQFIRKAADGSIVPCSPNKILVSTTQAIRPHKRILPIGFQSGCKTGIKGIGQVIEDLDTRVTEICGFGANEPMLIPLDVALDLLNQIEPTLRFDDDDAPPFDWDAARSALCHLSQQHPNPAERGQVLLWAARDRNSSRKGDESSHTFGGYIETPDSPKTEGKIAKKFSIDHPILFLLRQNGSADKGWRDTPFYWPVVRAQANAPTAIYTADIID